MLIFIPIKKLSQRVPGKNFREINGVPLYKHTLYKLEKYKVFVDTDSDKIVEECKTDTRLGHVSAFQRNRELIGHEVSVCNLIKDFIIKQNIDNSNICQLHVTSPFLNANTIDKAFEMINSPKGYDSIVACNKYQNRLWRKEAYGFCPINHNPIKLEQTQDLPVYYEENSLFYIFNSNYFLDTNCRVGINPYFYVCGYPENLDIDTEDDWKLVKTLCEK